MMDVPKIPTFDVGPSFSWSARPRKDGIDWRGTALAGLLQDALQTATFDERGVVEVNPLARILQQGMGHDLGTGAYFAGAGAALDSIGKRNEWIYPIIAALQGGQVLGNRSNGSATFGFPLIQASWKF